MCVGGGEGLDAIFRLILRHGLSGVSRSVFADKNIQELIHIFVFNSILSTEKKLEM